MSSPRLQVLIRLWRDGETSHSDLRQALSLDGASVTRLIKEFEAEGMVSRRIDPADNRSPRPGPGSTRCSPTSR
jgi:DNA-binding MarR family transcriptional regulator